MPERIGIIGNTQGVNDNSRPKPRKASAVVHKLPPSVLASVTDPSAVDGPHIEMADSLAPLPAMALDGFTDPPGSGASSISNVTRSTDFDIGG